MLADPRGHIPGKGKAAQIPANLPYHIGGATYFPLKDVKGYREEGVASWYGPKFHGKVTSSKEVYNMYSMTAAHRTLPFNTVVKVINLDSGAEAVVRINDRGPFVNSRIIDVSLGAADKLGMVAHGTARVKLIVVKEPDLDPSRDVVGPFQEVFTVQVAAFKEWEPADRIRRKLENGRITPYVRDNTEYYRVVVGKPTTFAKALKLRNGIRRQGYPQAFVIFENQP